MSFNWEEYEEPKKKKSPWVMVGCGVTAGVLMAGLVAFKKGNTGLSQAMMRARVLAQGATVALMAGTSGFYAMQKHGEHTEAAAPPKLDTELK